MMPEEIQPGWSVVDSKGEEVGTVVRAQGREFLIRMGHREVSVPNSACSYIEEHRVELNMSRKELEQHAAQR